jgi:hypothetical protein
MDGQWHGLVGNGTGYANIEIDDFGDHFAGRAHLFDAQVNFVIVSMFKTANKSSVQKIRVQLTYETVGGLVTISKDELKNKYPGATFPDEADIELRLTQKGLAVTVHIVAGTSKAFKATLPASGANRPSRLAADRAIKSWAKFKQMVGTLPRDKYIFRGQPVPKRLRSSFHRSNRKDLCRYINVDIPQMHRVLSSSTRHFFNLAEETQNAAFWNLLQHHGYPTPLLDWTHSPYVAAYFSLRTKAEHPEANRKVRIFMFDAAQWKADFTQLKSVANVHPHFSLLEAISLENPRAMPQQALSAITTVDDVESYLSQLGKERQRSYLRVFDLPYSERTQILGDLRLMGISAGALFPGIDGACEEMRSRMFAI